MIDITQPTIWGYAITPWLITFCLCVIGVVVCTILVVLGFSKKEKRELEMIENAVKNSTNIKAEPIEILTIDFDKDVGSTESIFDKGTNKTEGFDIKTEGFDIKTEGFDIKTEGFDIKTEGFDIKTEGFDIKTEGFDIKTEEFTQGD